MVAMKVAHTHSIDPRSSFKVFGLADDLTLKKSFKSIQRLYGCTARFF